jgi:hypothetical protein
MTYIETEKRIILAYQKFTMESTVTRQFVMLALHPEKGRVTIQDPHFRYSLIGAYFMDLLKNGEISMTNKRLTSSFLRNGDQLHDRVADIIERSSRPKRFSYWIRRFSQKSRLIFNETVNSLISRGILRHEKRYFLNLIPYNRYYFIDVRSRNEIIEGLRGVLLYGREATGDQMMLIALLKASSAHSIIARQKEERKILKKKCTDILQKDELSSEMNKVIIEVRAAIASSVSISLAASSGIY